MQSLLEVSITPNAKIGNHKLLYTMFYDACHTVDNVSIS